MTKKQRLITKIKKVTALWGSFENTLLERITEKSPLFGNFEILDPTHQLNTKSRNPKGCW